MRYLHALLALAVLALAAPPQLGAETEADAPIEDQWDALLEEHVRTVVIEGAEVNAVDYAAIKDDPRWPVLVKALETAEVPEDRDGQLAFWSNVYNILAIKVVLTDYPVNSIRDIGGWFRRVWNVDAGVVAGEMRTLHEVEHEILRELGDARIHSAIVCAAVSCPPLRKEAFRAEVVDEQFEEQTRLWKVNPEIGARLENDGRTLRLSRIYDWFSEDYEAEADSVLDWVRPYLSEEMKENMAESPRVRHFSYNWKLNDTANADE